jgi:hypothetical protein
LLALAAFSSTRRNHFSALLLGVLMGGDQQRELMKAFSRAIIQSLCDSGPGNIMPSQSGLSLPDSQYKFDNS